MGVGVWDAPEDADAPEVGIIARKLRREAMDTSQDCSAAGLPLRNLSLETKGAVFRSASVQSPRLDMGRFSQGRTFDMLAQKALGAAHLAWLLPSTDQGATPRPQNSNVVDSVHMRGCASKTAFLMRV